MPCRSEVRSYLMRVRKATAAQVSKALGAGASSVLADLYRRGHVDRSGKAGAYVYSLKMTSIALAPPAYSPKPPEGESVDAFLARGGSIERLPGFEAAIPPRLMPVRCV